MYTKQKLYMASLINKHGVSDEFFEYLEKGQQQVIDCMFLEFALRMELAKSEERTQKIALAWAISVYGEDASKFLAKLYAKVEPEEIDEFCDMYLE